MMCGDAHRSSTIVMAHYRASYAEAGRAADAPRPGICKLILTSGFLAIALLLSAQTANQSAENTPPNTSAGGLMDPRSSCGVSGNFVGMPATASISLSAPTTLTLSRSVLTSANTGMTVVVHGAGLASGPLVSTLTYLSGSTATLTVAASTAVSGAWVGIGTDDTAALQKCLNTAKGQNRSMALPTPATSHACYLVTKSLDAGHAGGLWIVGDGPGVGFNRSTICHALTETYPVLDFSGATRSGIRDLTIQAVNGDLSNSLATAGVYAKPAAGGMSPLYFNILDSQVYAGNSPGSAACIVSGVDQSVFQNSTCKGNYVGLVAGNGAGTTTAASKFYKLVNGYGDTLISILNCTIQGSQDTPLELDGSDDFEIGGNTYVVMGGAGTNNLGVPKGRLIDVHQAASYEWNKLHFGNTRTENQSKAGGVTALYLNGTTSTHAGTMDAALDTDHGGYAIGGPGSLVFYTVNITTNAATIFNQLGGMANTDFRLSSPVSSWGSVGGSPFGFIGNRVQTGLGIPAVLSGIPANATASVICSYTACQSLGGQTTPGQFSANTRTSATTYSTGTITPKLVNASSCSDQTFSVTGLAKSDHIYGVAPPGVLGNISIWVAYASAPNTLLLHFCNSSASNATPPSGAYTFIVQH